jgi:enterochelin esterase-like enzyme
VAVIAVLASAGGVLLAPPAPAVPPTSSPTATRAAGDGFTLDLTGTWRFSTGDDPAWKQPGFDDSAWERVPVPRAGGQEVFSSYDGYAWFRRSFRVPAGADGTALVAALGRIDDADEAFLNGRRIGGTGEFPPESDSQWFEQRLYPVPSSAVNYGGRNVLAVRMNDFTGGGGWYQGPVGLFSKDALRRTLYGLDTTAVRPRTRDRVLDLLQRQRRAVAEGRWRAYRRTLQPGFSHDGDTRARRVADLRRLTRKHGSLRVRDAEVEVVRDRRTGRLVADTNRSIVAVKPSGRRVLVAEVRQDFLWFTRSPRLRERGNHSRFFMDSVPSRLEGQDRDFMVYLPPSYFRQPARRYPTVYLFHGINGGAAEWETRSMRWRIDRMVRERGIEQSIVVMPDGESLWYVDSSEAPWRSMFIQEMLPLVDAAYRTRPRRGQRGITGISMGGHGAFTVGWSNPSLFSSIASHIGALSLPPLAGTPEDQAMNADERPNTQVVARTPEFLTRFRYYFDACRNDEFRFGEAAEEMDAQLTVKGVPHRWTVYPEGGHTDACWLPRMWKSFDLHSDSFRAHQRARHQRR